MQVGQEARVWLDLLGGFTKVPRFNMAVLSLPKQDKAQLGSLWDQALRSTSGTSLQEPLEQLRKQYKL